MKYLVTCAVVLFMCGTAGAFDGVPVSPDGLCHQFKKTWEPVKGECGMIIAQSPIPGILTEEEIRAEYAKYAPKQRAENQYLYNKFVECDLKEMSLAARLACKAKR